MSVAQSLPASFMGLTEDLDWHYISIKRHFDIFSPRLEPTAEIPHFVRAKLRDNDETDCGPFLRPLGLYCT